jgi:thymidylate synthase
MSHIDQGYLALLEDVLTNGVEKNDRTNTGTISVFGRQVRHDMKQGFPLLTTKKMYWKGIVTELLWFLRGDTNIKYLVDNGCNIWNGDAWKHYLKEQKDLGANKENASEEWFKEKIKKDDYFARTWGELGPIYGQQWRNWGNLTEENNFDLELKIIDQISNLISELKSNPDSRRLMVNAWNVGELDQMILPPCHYGFQVYTRELTYKERYDILDKRGYRGLLHSNQNSKGYKRSKKIIELIDQTCDDVNIPTREISLMWNQRSVDTFLGLPFNIASYGLLLEIIANEVNMIPGELVGNLGDVHLYKNHIDQAREQLTREPLPLSKLIINNEFWNPDQGTIEQINYITPDDFYIKDYQSNSTIKAPLNN